MSIVIVLSQFADFLEPRDLLGIFAPSNCLLTSLSTTYFHVFESEVVWLFKTTSFQFLNSQSIPLKFETDFVAKIVFFRDEKNVYVKIGIPVKTLD